MVLQLLPSLCEKDRRPRDNERSHGEEGKSHENFVVAVVPDEFDVPMVVGVNRNAPPSLGRVLKHGFYHARKAQIAYGE